MQQEWLQPELEAYWRLTPEELSLLEGRGRNNYLGFALMLKYFQLESRFPVRLWVFWHKPPERGICRNIDHISDDYKTKRTFRNYPPVWRIRL